jgi:hypothetical protein
LLESDMVKVRRARVAPEALTNARGTFPPFREFPDTSFRDISIPRMVPV